MNAPKEIRAGETTTWTESLSDYPASEGYTCKASLYKNSTQITLTAVADGDDHDFTISAVAGAEYAPGFYQMSVYVEYGSGDDLERYTIGTQTVEILPNLAASGGNIKGSIFSRRMLTAIEAVMESRATVEQKSFSHQDRALEYLSHEELIKARQYWKYQLQKDIQAENIKNGVCDQSNQIKVGFSRV